MDAIRPGPYAQLSVVIPAFNEVRGIRETLQGLIAAVPGAEIIVIDDASTDGTAAAAQEFPEVVLAQHPFNRGYGAGLKTGMTIAQREYVAWFDADNEHRASDLRTMFERIRAENLAAIIGQRQTERKSAVRTVGKWAIRMLAQTLDVKGGSDLNCGLRIFRRDVILRYLALLPNGFSASTTSTAIMLERRYPIAFHPMDLNPRIGSSTVRITHGFVTVMLVLRIIMLFAPMRIFLRAGAIIFLAGLVYGLAIALIVGRGLPVAAVFFMLGGLMFGFFGLIADQISQARLALYDQPLYRIVTRSGEDPAPQGTRSDHARQ